MHKSSISHLYSSYFHFYCYSQAWKGLILHSEVARTSANRDLVMCMKHIQARRNDSEGLSDIPAMT